ncbi:hypothetical protein J6590_025834 [Homalodisca vitripennis]|nr:hypothetical protein J6590_025834 [Homalodisca vitripennis]
MLLPQSSRVSVNHMIRPNVSLRPCIEQSLPHFLLSGVYSVLTQFTRLLGRTVLFCKWQRSDYLKPLTSPDYRHIVMLFSLKTPATASSS